MNNSTSLLIATGNRWKLQEILAVLGDLNDRIRSCNSDEPWALARAVLQRQDSHTITHGDLEAAGIRFKTLADFPNLGPPEENGSTFAENARLKAIYYSQATGLPTLADDSGLEVDALNGAPGIRSARYAGPNSNDRSNNAKLISELTHLPLETRTARFRCAVAVADGSKIVAESNGSVEGLIQDTPRGANGFGYDPHFYLPERNKTAAQLLPAEKNQISHRGRALRAIYDPLLRLLS